MNFESEILNLESEIMSKKVLFEDLGLVRYKEAWDYQE